LDFDYFFQFRPELLEMDTVRKNNNKTNLDQAFHLAEKEFGITRLLDTEGNSLLKSRGIDYHRSRMADFIILSVCQVVSCL